MSLLALSRATSRRSWAWMDANDLPLVSGSTASMKNSPSSENAEKPQNTV